MMTIEITTIQNKILRIRNQQVMIDGTLRNSMEWRPNVSMSR